MKRPQKQFIMHDPYSQDPSEHPKLIHKHKNSCLSNPRSFGGTYNVNRGNKTKSMNIINIMNIHKFTHTHKYVYNTHKYIYIYICMYVCMYYIVLYL